MAYNKAKEEKKWRLWKEAEEKQLRNLGVNEDDIEKLRIHDWAIFNSDRRYYQRVQETGTYLDELAEDTTQPEVKTVEDFLDSIENQCLYQILIKVDRLTLQIALMKIQGYSTREIAVCLNSELQNEQMKDESEVFNSFINVMVQIVEKYGKTVLQELDCAA